MDNGTNVPSSGHEVSGIPGDLPLDIAKYQDDLAELEIAEDQWRELLETMWSIMRLFVECGFNVDVAGRAAMDIFNQAAHGEPKDEA
jgi:hypothetical protein